MYHKKPDQSPLNFLEMVPIRLREHIVEENGLVSIVVPKFKNEMWTRFLVPTRKSKIIRVKLDKMGTAIWLEFDGIAKVEEIVTSLKAKDKPETASENFDERVYQFITLLYKHEHIDFK